MRIDVRTTEQPKPDWRLRAPVGGTHCVICQQKIYDSKAYQDCFLPFRWLCLSCAPAWFKSLSLLVGVKVHTEGLQESSVI
jgi:hypothetical protein